MDKKSLIDKAYEAASKAYVPYSGFRVGAAVVTGSGHIFSGCNVENASYGATICAERVAITKAVSEGHTDFLAIAIVSLDSAPVYPCGICRQFLREFNEDFVLIFDDDGKIKELELKEMLPYSFGPESLNENLKLRGKEDE